MKGEAISALESGADFFSGKWVNEQEPNDVISIIKRDNEAYFVYGRRLALQQYHYGLFGNAIKVDVNNKTLEGRIIDEFQLVISREENRLVLVLPSLNKIEYMTGYYVRQQ